MRPIIIKCILAILIGRVLFFGIWDDAENLSHYYAKDYFSSPKEDSTLVYGPVHYSVLHFLQFLNNSLIFSRISIIIFLLLCFQFLFKNYKEFIIFLCIPGVQHFITSFRPDSLALGFSLLYLGLNKSRSSFYLKILTLTAILSIKPNLIVFPIIIQLFTYHKPFIKELSISLIVSALIFLGFQLFTQQPILTSMFIDNVNEFKINSILFWKNYIGLTTIMACLLLIKKINTTTFITFVFSSIMALKVGSNLNYYLFFFLTIAMQSRIPNFGSLLFLFLLNFSAALVQFDYIKNDQGIKQWELHENYVLAPSFLILNDSINIKFPDAHMWRYSDKGLPDSGRAILYKSDMKDPRIQQFSSKLKLIRRYGKYVEIEW